MHRDGTARIALTRDAWRVRGVLAGRGEFRVRHPGDGRHVEADLSLQVMALIQTFPASHGCLRVPIPDAWSIYRWVRMGSVVHVYP